MLIVLSENKFKCLELWKVLTSAYLKAEQQVVFLIDHFPLEDEKKQHVITLPEQFSAASLFELLAHWRQFW